MRKIFLSISLLILSTPFSYSGKYHSDEGVLWWRDADIKQELRLSESQVTKIETIFQSYKDKFKKEKNKIQEKREEFHKLFSDPNATREAIVSKHKELYKLKNEARSMKLKMHLDIREVLSVEQREQLMKIRSKKHKKNYKKPH